MEIIKEMKKEKQKIDIIEIISGKRQKNNFNVKKYTK